MSHKSVPVIDIEPLSGGHTQRQKVVAEIREACCEWGIFHIVRHGISMDLLSRVWRETKEFFALPADAKQAIVRTKDNARGWFNREFTKNARDMKELFDFGFVPHPELPENDPANWTRDGFNQWPKVELCPNFRQTIWEYFRACERISLRLLEGVGESLGVLPACLTREFVNEHTSFLRLNYYPKHDPLHADQQALGTGHLGVHHHTDAGALTVLFQADVSGLQVYLRGE